MLSNRWRVHSERFCMPSDLNTFCRILDGFLEVCWCVVHFEVILMHFFRFFDVLAALL